MTFDTFARRARRAANGVRSGPVESCLVPVWRDILLDAETPVAAFAKLRRAPFAFLLESAPAGGETWARYTFLGTEPRAAWRLADGVVEDWTPARGWHGARRPPDPLADLESLLAQHRPVDVPELGDFWSGAVGYFGYDVATRLRGPSVLAPLELDPAAPPATGESCYARERFLRDVERIREYIVAGDVFQVLLARRVAVPHDFSSESLYRALRVINPSPYMYHLSLDGVELVGSSPELLVRVRGGRVTVRPIAGTRPRGATADADAALAAELAADEKERAEHVMLVDLGRNDVGRVAKYGTVEVTELMAVERYSHVLHLVSQVDGELRDGLSAVDAFRATFPAGTMTGAPKVRAMEIIDELEPERRGPYAGAVGYLSVGGGRMDLAITIRTCLIAGGVANVQAGAGIVHDSVPEREWEETENKARALLTAIGRVRAAAARDHR